MICALILMGGRFSLFYDIHAVIVIFGGSFAATMIRFPFSAHRSTACRMGVKFAFTMRRITPRELIDEITKIAERSAQAGPMALENVEVDDAFLAQGIRFIADGYDREFIRDNDGARPRQLPDASGRGLEDLSRHRRLRAGLGHDRHADRHGADVRQHGGPLEARSRSWRWRCWRRSTARWSPTCLPCRSPTSCMLKLMEEEINRTLIIDGILMIRDAKSPTLVREMLLAYLPEKHRHERRRSGRRRERLTPASGRQHGQEEGGGHGGGHGWFVTFADLMALLMSFFVMLVAYSTQDQNKLQIVAGSMRDAFGTQTESRFSGIVEADGLPTRPKLKNVNEAPPEQASDFTAPETSFDRPDEGVRGDRLRPRLRAGGRLAAAGAASARISKFTRRTA